MQRVWQLGVIIFSCLQLVVLSNIATDDSWTHSQMVEAFTPIFCVEKAENHLHDGHVRGLEMQGVLPLDGSLSSLRVNLSSHCMYRSPYANYSSRVFHSRVSVSNTWSFDPTVRDGLYTETYHRINRSERVAYLNLLKKTGISLKTFRKHGVSGTKSLSFPVVRGKALYKAEIQVGTPGQRLLLELDTGSDLTWMKCRPGVSTVQREHGNKLFFDPDKSSTFRTYYADSLFNRGPGRTFATQCISSYKQPNCNFFQKYADGTFAGGSMVSETITDGGSTNGSIFKAPLITLGCESSSFGDFDTGILGLGRGMLSLPTQLGEHYRHRFAYCLSSKRGYNSSYLRFGDSASPSSTAASGVKFLSLIKNPRHPSFYYLRLEGLSVGGEQLHLPRDIFIIDKATGTGGVILDTGTTFTFLPVSVYEKLAEAFRNKMSSFQIAPPSVKLTHCFNISTAERLGTRIPKIVLRFREEEDLVDIELPAENYVKRVAPDKACLAVLPNHVGVSGAPSIIGNMWQRNFHVFIDNRNNSVGFLGPKLCREKIDARDDEDLARSDYALDVNDDPSCAAFPTVVPLTICLLLIVLLFTWVPKSALARMFRHRVLTSTSSCK